MQCIAEHGLDISRAVFMQGRAPYKSMTAFNMSLFPSANEDDVRQATAAGMPAGTVMPSAVVDDPEDHDLRIAFDFDGVGVLPVQLEPRIADQMRGLRRR